MLVQIPQSVITPFQPLGIPTLELQNLLAEIQRIIQTWVKVRNPVSSLHALTALSRHLKEQILAAGAKDALVNIREGIVFDQLLGLIITAEYIVGKKSTWHITSAFCPYGLCDKNRFYYATI